MTDREFYSILGSTEKGQEYLKLINKAENRENSGLSVLEKHHIHPKGLGGSNVKENLVALTIFEHCLAHLLLVQAIPCAQTFKPVQRMSSQFSTLEDCQKATLEDVYHWSEWREKAIHCLHSPEHSAAISRARKGQRCNNIGTVWMSKNGKNKRVRSVEVSEFQKDGWILGRVQETRDRIKKSCQGRVGPNLGRKMSDQMKAKMRAVRTGIVYVHKDGKSYQTKDLLEVEKLLSEGWVRGRGKQSRYS